MPSRDSRIDRRSDLRARLFALGGLMVIVGGAVGILFAVGLIGNQSGGEGIKDVSLLDPPRATGQADLKVGPEAGRLSPDFEISDFDGVRHRLADFRGRTVYLNFWGTWCIPCAVELPDIQT